VHRLEKDVFDPTFTMTDGIVMSTFPIQDIDFSFIDFAGQEEYDHTHSLFFKSETIFLVLHNPRADSNLDRLEEFFTMIADKAWGAQVIVVTTHANEVILEDHKVEALRRRHLNIVNIVAVDSKENIGIDDLKTVLVAAALILPRTTTEVPINFAKMLDHITTEISVNGGSFSLSYEEFAIIASNRFSIDDKSALIAKELFCFWGRVFELSNGDLVLNPQQLADVLACIFTKEPNKLKRMGDIGKGILWHRDSIVREIWGDRSKYPKHLWSFESASVISNPEIPAFLNLLHRAELGYPLYGPKGLPLGATFIPALLPENPIGYDPAVDLIDFFQLKVGCAVRHPDVVLSFTKPQPQQVFISHLIVRLRHNSMIDGVWKHGAVLKGGDGCGNNSICIFFVESNRMTVLSFGSSDKSTGARSVFFNELLNLVAEKYPSLRAQSIQFGTTLFNLSDVQSCIYSGGFIESKGMQLSLRRISALFGLNAAATTTTPSSHVGNTSMTLFSLYNSPLGVLKNSLSQLTLNTEGELDVDDHVNLVYVLLNCVPCIVSLQGLPTSRVRGIHTLWVVYRSTETNVTSVFAIASGAKPTLAWRLVDESAIHNILTRDSDQSSTIVLASDILKTALSYLQVVKLKPLEYIGLRDLRDLEDKIKHNEDKYFAPIDDSPTAHYILKSNMSLAVGAYISGHFKDLKNNLIQGFADIGKKVEQILVLGLEATERLEKGLEILRRTVVNLKQRTCPTLVIILPRNPTDFISLDHAASLIARAKTLFCFDEWKGDLTELLLEKEYLALVCELCHQPQFPAIELTSPKEYLTKILPLAKVGLKVACSINNVSSLATLFGFPTLSLPTKQVDEFMKQISESSLEDYESLQKRVQQVASNSSSNEVSLNKNDYCAREFQRFLDTRNVPDKWCGLSAKVTDGGDVFFACKNCCQVHSLCLSID